MTEPVDAPRSASRRGEIKEDKAVKDGKFTLVHQGEEASGSVNHEIGDSHFPRENEGGDAGKKPDGKKNAANQFQNAGKANHGEDLEGAWHVRGRHTEQF